VTRRAASAITGLFLVTGLVGLLHHEMWRDELEIWLIAVGSRGLGDLLANMSTEGHPVLWYALNFALARITSDPLAMQLLNLAAATAAVFVFLRRAPFPPIQRLAFCFGYYLLYEFTVISRGYALGLLLVFAFCSRFARVRRVDWLAAGLLFLLANTTLYGTIVAAHVVLLAVGQALGDRQAERLRRDRLPLLAVLVGVAAGFGHTWLQALAIGSAHADAYTPEHDVTWVARCLGTMFRGAVPVADPTNVHSWNSHVLELLPQTWSSWIGALGGVGGLALALRALGRRPVLAGVFRSGSLTMLAIVFFVWFGSMRHHGQVFLWFVVCCWLAEGLRPLAGAPSGLPTAPAGAVAPGGRLLTALLVAQVVAGAQAWAIDLARPFSNARAVGVLLRRPEVDGVRLVGSVDYAIQPVAAYAGRAFYYPESGRVGTFLDWGPGRRRVSLVEVLEDVRRLLQLERRDVILVLNYPPEPLDPGEQVRLGEGARLLCFAGLVGAIVPDEDYYLCRAFLEEPARGPGR
jgi:hypothetical protein